MEEILKNKLIELAETLIPSIVTNAKYDRESWIEDVMKPNTITIFFYNDDDVMIDEGYNLEVEYTEKGLYFTVQSYDKEVQNFEVATPSVQNIIKGYELWTKE